ncbi:MAG: SAM-dependent methyltransferase [Dehalococcoidia bacterium]|nr:SAM-dependent methyltransferase [Dehalococcoidia bacterium]
MADAPLEERLREEMRRKGHITFAEFMSAALYDPRDGYYTSRPAIGAAGDFYTSPVASPVFGALLARQLEQMWRIMDRPAKFPIIEFGAGTGMLCHDILTYAAKDLPDFWKAIEYLPVEHRAEQITWLQSEALCKDRMAVVSVTDLSAKDTGCILTNEFIDALPVHRVTMKDGKLREIYVSVNRKAFVEKLDEPSTPALAERLASEDVALKEGWVVDIWLESDAWVDKWAGLIKKGFILTIDYGDIAQKLFTERRKAGTLLCHYKHTYSTNPYERIGRQDLTAHVDFTSLVNAARRSGLTEAGYTTQADFLTNLGIGTFLRKLESMPLGQHDIMANGMGMRELIKEDGIGKFKVLALSKGIEPEQLSGFTADALKPDMPPVKHVPLLTRRHTSLMQGKYPHQELDAEELWRELTS